METKKCGECETRYASLAMLEQEQIKEIIPHREPFLLIDRIIELEPGKKAAGVKWVREDEPHFQGHFPGHPVMPGVLIVEALAQTGAVALLSVPENKGKIAFFARIENARFRKQVVPPSALRLEVEIVSAKRGVGKGIGVAKVGGEIVCEAEMTFALGNGEKK